MTDPWDVDWQDVRRQIAEHYTQQRMFVRIDNPKFETIKPVVQFAKSDDGDWIGCYVNGELIDQGHSLYVVHLMEMVSDRLGFVLADTLFYTDDQMEEMGGNFPARLEEING